MFRIKRTFGTDFADVHVREEAIQPRSRPPLLLLPLGLFEPPPYGRVAIGKLLDVDAVIERNGFGPGNPLNDGLKPEACAWRQHRVPDLVISYR